MVDALASSERGSDAIDYFDARADALAADYESVAFEEVHRSILDCLPQPGAEVLDVGAGSGRDAAALADRGLMVVAVEPAGKMLANAKLRHGLSTIEWVEDRLPGLIKLDGRRFQLVLLSAVWMFIPPIERSAAMHRLSRLLVEQGVAVLDVLPNGPTRTGFHPTPIAELVELARRYGMRSIRCCRTPDALGRPLEWTTLVLRREG